MTNQKGFTLIETLVYIMLFAIVIGGGMVAAYQIIQATDASLNHVILQEEANFLLRKVNWALTGATNVNPTASNLVVTKHINSTLTTLKFNYVPPNLTLQRSSGAPIILNSGNISITSLTFAKTASGNGITTTFTLKTIQNGPFTIQSFSTTKYLRQ